jgi:hypothetical protein
MEDSSPLALKDTLKKLFSRKKAANIPKLASSKPQASIEEPVSEYARAHVQEPNIIETYPLNGPYAFANIVRDPSRGNLTYMVEEPKLSQDDVLQLERLKGLLMEVLDVNMSKLESKEAAKEYLERKSAEVLDHYDFKLDKAAKGRLLYYILRDNLGFGKIDPLMHDPSIEDISCDKPLRLAPKIRVRADERSVRNNGRTQFIRVKTCLFVRQPRFDCAANAGLLSARGKPHQPYIWDRDHEERVHVHDSEVQDGPADHNRHDRLQHPLC